ncbi:MAG: ABC transporter ATP-binding protein [Beijerinckiaceae bacterium]
MVEPLLAITNLRKSFGSLAVTDGVTLDVRPGELHALIGPNGAGKTTLIHQISGTLAPNSGSILFRGEDITRLPMHLRVRRGLARSFQITSILPAFSVLDNVALAVQARSGSSFRFFAPASDETRLNDEAMQALADVGLTARSGLRAGLLSHGEKRLLELAIAIATNAQFLLLDEPLAGLGHEESAQAISMLRGLKSRYSMLLVEHDMDAVFSLADRISVLVYGRIIAVGTPAEIMANTDVRKAYLGDGETG